MHFAVIELPARSEVSSAVASELTPPNESSLERTTARALAAWLRCSRIVPTAELGVGDLSIVGGGEKHVEEVSSGKTKVMLGRLLMAKERAPRRTTRLASALLRHKILKRHLPQVPVLTRATEALPVPSH